MNLEYKSTGALIDEWLTAILKASAQATNENITRRDELLRIVNQRVGKRWEYIQTLVERLRLQLGMCWNAQEVVMQYRNTGVMQYHELLQCSAAGIEAQRTNAERCALVRQIDAILGESSRTYLEKTYA